MAKHNEIGKIGENIAADFIKNKGLTLLERNYWKPYGEIDIVAREKDLTRFIEVKAVSYETARSRVPHETIRPEENLHIHKIRRLRRVIEAYVVSHGTGEWTFDLMCVYVNRKERTAKVKWLKDIVLS